MDKNKVTKQPKSFEETLVKQLGTTYQTEYESIKGILESEGKWRDEFRYILYAFVSTLEDIQTYSEQIPQLKKELEANRKVLQTTDSEHRNALKFTRDNLNFAIDKKSDATSKMITLSDKLGLSPKSNGTIKATGHVKGDDTSHFLKQS